MKQRKQSSTTNPITFLLVSSSDHVTAVTGITPTVTISKNGGSFASPSGAVSEIGNGWYAIAGNATDRNTTGDLLIHATGTGADPCDDRYSIVPWDPFDAAALGLTNLDAAISTRSTYAGADTSGTTTLLSRLSSTRATNLDNLDTTVSSRLATSGYTAPSTPPTVAAIRTEMDSNSTKLANLDATVSSRLASGSYTAPDNTSITAIKAITDTLGLTAIADALLKRDFSAVSGEASRSMLNALRAIRNKVSRSGSTITVTKEDDTASAWTATITTDATAAPITTVDPA